jgi:hypothetical protein
MTDQYHIDLEGFSLERFKHTLETGDLLPGRRILREEVSKRFQILESMGIRNLKELTDALSTKKKLERFSQGSGLPKDYLVILRRQANSYRPNPVNLNGIPGVDPEYIGRLAAIGIKNSRHLWERGASRTARAELSRLTDVPGDVLLELVTMSDLARVSGVGPVFARIILDAGIDGLEELADSSSDELIDRLVAANEKKGYTRADFTVKDVQYCIDMAKELPKAIEY